MTRITGSAWKDDLFADPSGSIIQGLGAADVILGNLGNDDLYGGTGNDALIDNYGGADRLYGGAGDDVLEIDRGGRLTGGPVLLDGGADDDVIRAYHAQDSSGTSFTDAHIIGGSGNDQMYASGIAGLIEGGSGDDSIYAQYSSARIDAGPGNDLVSFLGVNGAGAMIDAGSGNDTVQATTYNADATITTGDGNDQVTLSMQGGTHQGHVDLGGGDDHATAYGLTSDVFVSLLGGAGNDTLAAYGFAVEARGGSGNDHITVEATSAIIDAGSGSDTVTIGSEADYTVVLGDGPDRLEIDAVFTHSPETDDYVRVTDFRTGNSGDVLDLTGALAQLGWSSAQGDPFDAGYARLREFAPGVSSTFVDLSDGKGGWVTEALLIGVAVPALNAHNLDGFTP